MPTYQYICEKCGHSFEKVQSISARPLAVCPQNVCPRKPWAKGAVKRAITGGAGFIFKGSGFYATDYRSEQYKEAAKKDVPATAPAAANGKTGSESKPAAKPDPKPASSPKAD
jgi:putative FmdB family regulatory protein